ncbi:hypothetical protein [Neptunomonas antarctica]|uniref:Uncharacterized protein n=1 Tax=Neptunomonas antarctica TaxID=619304 RepID=A0A1N7NY07_9GAMM|nr:hypothetical protein [Neptunomonas antarctica]SIT03202.1 hypothetical protein SAMN05421760_111141 [Neptunomonas antarctica]
MNIHTLRNIRNRNVQQQNELMFLVMEEIANSFIQKGQPEKWLDSVLEMKGFSKSSGILIEISDLPDQFGHWWSGSWLSNGKDFYDFEVLVNLNTNDVIDIELWNKVEPEILAHKKGIGKTPAFIALELLSKYGKS